MQAFPGGTGVQSPPGSALSNTMVLLADLTRAVNALPQNMTSQMFSAIAAVTGQGQNPNATPAQWASSQYGYGGSGGGSSAYHVGVTSKPWGQGAAWLLLTTTNHPMGILCGARGCSLPEICYGGELERVLGPDFFLLRK